MKKLLCYFIFVDHQFLKGDHLAINDIPGVSKSESCNQITNTFSSSSTQEPPNPDEFDFIVQKVICEKNMKIDNSMDGHINEAEHLQMIMKEEKRKYNNKMAARRCRKRKEDKIRHLEQMVAQLQEEHDHGKDVLNELSSSITNLKQELLQHTQQGCNIYANY